MFIVCIVCRVKSGPWSCVYCYICRIEVESEYKGMDSLIPACQVRYLEQKLGFMLLAFQGPSDFNQNLSRLDHDRVPDDRVPKIEPKGSEKSCYGIAPGGLQKKIEDYFSIMRLPWRFQKHFILIY